MSFLTALHLSLNNIRTKKGRTILTSFASSIGIIGISLILALSNGFSKQIDKFERDTSDAMPIIITYNKISEDTIKSQIASNQNDGDKYSKKEEVSVKKENDELKFNNISSEFIDYMKKINNKNISSVGLNYSTNLNFIQKSEDNYYLVNSTENNAKFMSIPFKNFSDKNTSEIISNYYDLLRGKLPKNYDELLIEIDSTNKIDESLKKALGISKDTISFDDILNSNIKLVFNDDLYNEYNGYYLMNNIDKNIYEKENNLTLKVVGIIRTKKSKENVLSSSSGLYYTDELINYIMIKNSESKIVKKQESSDYNVLTGVKFENNSKGEREKKTILEYLGKNGNPITLNIYPKDFDKKDKIIDYIEKYNDKKEDKDKIAYLDQAKLITNISGGIMSGITTVLVAFSSISLIVSSIMIGIITYISVLERTKEIGILRSLGARKKDIRRVFNAETFIIGLTSGILGIVVSKLLLYPINYLLKNITDLDNVAVMNYKYSFILILISVLLTLIGGAIPSSIASKKDPVESLRVE